MGFGYEDSVGTSRIDNFGGTRNGESESDIWRFRVAMMVWNLGVLLRDDVQRSAADLPVKYAFGERELCPYNGVSWACPGGDVTINVTQQQPRVTI